LSDTKNSLPEKKLTCSDCPVSLACVAGAVSYVLACEDCRFAFAYVGREGASKQEVRLPWQLRHSCKHIVAVSTKPALPNRNFRAYGNPWKETRCRKCQLRYSLSGGPGPQKMFMTPQQYDDLVQSLGHLPNKPLVLPTNVELSTVNTPADRVGIPAGFIGGVPVELVPESVLGKDQMMILGADNGKFSVQTTIGDKSKVFSGQELEKILRDADVAERTRYMKQFEVVESSDAAGTLLRNTTHDISDAEDRKLLLAMRGVEFPDDNDD